MRESSNQKIARLELENARLTATNVVQFSVKRDNSVAKLEILAPRVRTTTNFSFGAVSEESVEAGRRVCLYETAITLQHVLVALERRH